MGLLLGMGCIEHITGPPSLSPECRLNRTTDPAVVPGCLLAQGAITAADRALADAIIADAIGYRDSVRADTGIANFYKAVETNRALIHVSQLYGRGLLADSARFHRLVDHVAVTLEVQRGPKLSDLRVLPRRTPYLMWIFYPGNGVFFQPVSTAQNLGFLSVRANLSLDSLRNTGEALWAYAVWRSHDGMRFPVWEYEFTNSSGGVVNEAPWVSGQAQGLVLIVFAELYKRTGDARWRQRAFAVLKSFRVLWDDGGVLLPDTMHGYWWEEYSPYNRIWNGSAQAALGVGVLWRATGDAETKRMFDRSVEALKYFTPLYDTGSWTLYSVTDGYNSQAYHAGCIAILDALYATSGDTWFKDLADRWRSYVAPPGVP